jgi:serine/threonine protein kinase
MLRRLGKYELLERIALGGMAEVYRARQEGPAGFEKELVVKRILPQHARDEQFIEMFLDEARLAVRLAHPNIVQIIELGYEDGSYFIAMEYIRGISLGDLMDRAAVLGLRLPYHYVARIMASVCAGLDYAHAFADVDGQSIGLVHRDVSPDNVLVSYNGAVKMIDFGVAKAATNETKTNSGVVKGKFCYMSPEQIQGQPLDGRSDIFSVGILLYEACVGTRPFSESSGLGTVSAIMTQEPPLPRERSPDMPLDLQAIILRALVKDRDQRYPQCRDMQRELEQFIQSHAQYIGESDIGEFVRRVARGTPDDVRWLNALHAEVSVTPVGSSARPNSAVTRRPSRSRMDAVSNASISPPTLREAGKLGGVGVASGHLAHLGAPSHGAPGFRRTESTPMARRRAIALVLFVLVVAAGTALFFAWRDSRHAALAEGAGAVEGERKSPDGTDWDTSGEPQEAPVEEPPQPVISERIVITAPGTSGMLAVEPSEPAADPPEGAAPEGPAGELESPPSSESAPQPDSPGGEGGSEPAAVAPSPADPDASEAPEVDHAPDAVQVAESADAEREAGPAEVEAGAPSSAPSGAIRGQGTLSVNSNIAGAEVWINGHKRGTTPYREALVEGTHEVDVRVAGESQVRKVKVGYGTGHSVDVNFRLGRLTITDVPAGAVCSVDDRPIGRWDLADTVIAAGSHRVVCEDPALGVTHEQRFTVRNGARTTIAHPSE